MYNHSDYRIIDQLKCISLGNHGPSRTKYSFVLWEIMDQVVPNIHLSNSKGHWSNMDEAAKHDNCILLQSMEDERLNDIKLVLDGIPG